MRIYFTNATAHRVRGKAKIGLAVGAVYNTYKMSKNLELDIDDARFTFPSKGSANRRTKFRSLEYAFCATECRCRAVQRRQCRPL
jgi:hypothetical protein